MTMNDRLKAIFKDRVKYKIQNDQKYNRKVDSLRCKLRAEEIEKNKIKGE